MDISEKLHSENHLDIARSYYRLSYRYYELGQYQNALEYDIKRLTCLKIVLGDRHPDVATCYCNIGRDYKGLGNSDMAIESYKAALDIMLDIEDEGDYKTSERYMVMAAIYDEMGDYEKQIDCL